LGWWRKTVLDQQVDRVVGDLVGTLGFPGELETESADALLRPIPTFKQGIVSALRPYPTSTFSNRISNRIVQHDLDLTPGTSGSPIFNKRGEVVAINNAGIVGTSLGFGIRAEVLREVMEGAKGAFPGLYGELNLKQVTPQLRRGGDTRPLLPMITGRPRRSIEDYFTEIGQ
jgi:S1-C subfamily serine protease